MVIALHWPPLQGHLPHCSNYTACGQLLSEVPFSAANTCSLFLQLQPCLPSYLSLVLFHSAPFTQVVSYIPSFYIVMRFCVPVMMVRQQDRTLSPLLCKSALLFGHELPRDIWSCAPQFQHLAKYLAWSKYHLRQAEVIKQWMKFILNMRAVFSMFVSIYYDKNSRHAYAWHGSYTLDMWLLFSRISFYLWPYDPVRLQTQV